MSSPIIPPNHSSTIYTGHVYHHRIRDGISCDAGHAFRYEVVMGLVDLTSVENNHNNSYDHSSTRWVAWGDSDPRWTWTRWRRSDHFHIQSSEEKLSTSIYLLLEQHLPNIAWKQCSIKLLTNLSCLGYNFNPISMYYVMMPTSSSTATTTSTTTNQLAAIVLEVSNTPWLEKRMYVLDMRKNDDDQQQHIISWEKDFHVSPFFDEGHVYSWQFNPPPTSTPVESETIDIIGYSTRKSGFTTKQTSWESSHHITGTDIQTKIKSNNSEISPSLSCLFAQQQQLSPDDEPSPDSNDNNKLKPTFKIELHLVPCLNSATIGKAMKRHLAMPFEIVLWIHLEAFRVWRKGNSYVTPPANVPPLSLKDLFRHLFIFLIGLKSRLIGKLL
jgi:DUF1365 family protein